MRGTVALCTDLVDWRTYLLDGKRLDLNHGRCLCLNLPVEAAFSVSSDSEKRSAPSPRVLYTGGEGTMDAAPCPRRIPGHVRPLSARPVSPRSRRRHVGCGWEAGQLATPASSTVSPTGRLAFPVAATVTCHGASYHTRCFPQTPSYLSTSHPPPCQPPSETRQLSVACEGAFHLQRVRPMSELSSS